MLRLFSQSRKEELPMEPMEDASTIEQRMLNRAKAKKVPINGSIELLPLCNMNCDMCYVRLSPAEMEKQGRLRTLEEWLQLAEEMVKEGVLFLLLTGGEPLLYPQFKELYLALKQMGMILTINTNGTLIDEEWADFFAKNKPRRINITLYGADDETYATLCHYPKGYTKTIRGIRLLRERGVDVKIGNSVAKHNRKDLEQIHAIGDELQVPVRTDTYMVPGVRERNRPYNEQSRLSPADAAEARIQALKLEFPPELFQQYVEQTIALTEHHDPSRYSRHVSCLAGNCSFTINWQGEMHMCVVMTQPSAPVFEVGFRAAWQHLVAETEKLLIHERCVECPKRVVCHTCAASAFLETGAYDGIPQYLCDYAEETLRLIYQEQEVFSHEPTTAE